MIPATAKELANLVDSYMRKERLASNIRPHHLELVWLALNDAALSLPRNEDVQMREALRKCYVELQYCEMQLRAANGDYRKRDEMWEAQGAVYEALRMARTILANTPELKPQGFWGEIHSKYRQALDLKCNCHEQCGDHPCPQCDVMTEAMHMLKAALEATPTQPTMTEEE